MPDKKQARIRREIKVLARRIEKSVRNLEKLPSPPFRSFFFKVMTGMMRRNTWNPRDRKHWEDHGWLAGASPFRARCQPAKSGNR